MIRILFALIVLAPVSAMAAQVCLEVPDGVTYASIQSNFDGSVTITTPKVLVNGAYIYLSPDQTTAVGFCKFLDKVAVQYSLEYLQDYKSTATMDAKGRFSGVVTLMKYMSVISCRETENP